MTGATKLRLVNDSKIRGDRNWKWNVWLEGPEIEEGKVSSVTYYLHPTFRNPVQQIDRKSTKFKLSGSGWGEFNIQAEVLLNDDTVRTLDHWLEFKGMRRVRKSDAPQVYLYHGVADGPTANVLAHRLMDKDLHVVASAMTDVVGDEHWQRELEKAMNTADLNVLFISAGMLEFLDAEVSRMLSTVPNIDGKLLPVLLGSTETLDQLRDVRSVRISSINEMDKVVEAVEKLLERK